MKTRKWAWGVMAGALALGTLMVPSEARTEEEAEVDGPRTAGVLQFAAGFRYGIALDDPAPDPWGAGLGLELGYTFPKPVYLGIVFDHFWESSDTVDGVKWIASLWQLGVEGGYDLQLSEGVLVRPKLGAGVATISRECDWCAIEGPQFSGWGATSHTDICFGAAPGLTTMLFTSVAVFSIDARYQMVFAKPDTTKALILSFGIGF